MAHIGNKILNNAEMQEVLKGGHSVLFQGRLCTRISDLPSDAEISRVDPTLRESAMEQMQAEMARLQQQWNAFQNQGVAPPQPQQQALYPQQFNASRAHINSMEPDPVLVAQLEPLIQRLVAERLAAIQSVPQGSGENPPGAPAAQHSAQAEALPAQSGGEPGKAASIFANAPSPHDAPVEAQPKPEPPKKPTK